MNFGIGNMLLESGFFCKICIKLGSPRYELKIAKSEELHLHEGPDRKRRETKHMTEFEPISSR